MSSAGALETPETALNSPVRRANSESPVLGGSESFLDSAGFWLYANPIRVIRSDSGLRHPERCEESPPCDSRRRVPSAQKICRAYMRREYDMTRTNEAQ